MIYRRGPWSPQESEILSANYPTGGNRLCKQLLPGRSGSAIASQAFKLGVHSRSGAPRVKIDEARAIALYRKHGKLEMVCDILGVGMYVVARVMKENSVELKGFHATDAAKDAIIADYRSALLTKADIAAKHGFTASTLGKALARWGVVDPYQQQKLAANGVTEPNRVGMYDCWLASHGKEEADRRKEAWSKKASANTSGINNPMYGRPSPTGSGNGWKGWYRDIHFRSLREWCFMLQMERDGIPWISAESIRIPYPFNGGERTYSPDFLVRGTELIEVKPHNLHNTHGVKAKQAAAETFCRDRGWTYRVTDVPLDTEAMWTAYIQGLARFENRYEERFLLYHQNQGRPLSDDQLAKLKRQNTHTPSTKLTTAAISTTVPENERAQKA